MVDAEPMGKYISIPHRAATFHITIGLHVLTSQMRTDRSVIENFLEEPGLGDASFFV